ncbi:hypothetical protein I302_106774 [Kwoniella bestiolae CBS 10118]|uniref:Dynamin N-terminal domain-containing protein n=1 Tax=Kwoniella bestiolae CBS 10118 TaxID=1296100 RepID=A0A1B9G0G0_9TREE|nr:hypothetical protein I302_05960 [Kwoniella bestiolae CBS 10118]OCF24500.1 hypothetical protein I302_05960 [Kwoniella bestiolae CBS 10118]
MKTSTLPSIPQTPTPSTGSKEVLDVFRQRKKHTPLGAYPTPQSSLDLSSPLGNGSTTLLTRTNTSSINGGDTDEDPFQVGEGEINNFLKIHDQLARLFPNEKQVSVPRLCALGGQSAGKSSLFSGVSDTPLYCASGRATCCPHLIRLRSQSRVLKVDIFVQVTNTRTDTTNVLPFALDLGETDQIARLLPLASDEARRADGGYNIVRPWSALQSLSEDQRKSDESTWADVTSNVVIINISGFNLPNFDIEDLPGLHGNPLIEISDRISQQQNIIVLCLAGTGQEPSTDNREIQLAMKYDPTGERTIGVITRADAIEVIPGDLSPFVEYFNGQTDDLGGFNPQWGWWPLRLRSSEERRNGISLKEVRNRENLLFSTEDWLDIQDKAGRKFGIGELEKKLEEVFRMKVEENIVQLKKTLRGLIKSHSEWLIQNPTMDNPVAALHDNVIYRFHKTLKTRIERSNSSGKLVDLQQNLETDMQNLVPEFVPYLENQLGEGDTYKSFCEENKLSVMKEDIVYLDVLAEMIKGVSNRREPGVIETQSIVQSFIDKYSSKWRELVVQHIDALWNEVTGIQNLAIQEICGDNIPLREEVSAKLEDLIASLKEDSLSFLDHMSKIITSPFSHSGRGYSSEYQDALKAATKGYSAFLKSPNADHHHRRARSSSSTPSEVNSSVPSLGADMYTELEREQCTALQAKITVLIMNRSLQFSTSIGEHAQECVMEYIEKVTPTLRKKMGLDEVVENVRKRAGDIFESDKKKKKEREDKVREMKKLNEIRQHLENIVEM